MVVNVKNGPLNPLAFAVGVDASNKGARSKLFNSSTSAPTTANDNTQGYQPGSIWARSNTRQVWICDDVTTNAAVWTQLELSNFPTYIVGNWYIQPNVLNLTGAPVAPGSGSIRLYPDFIKERLTISALGVRVVGTSGGGNIQAALYAADPVTLKPTGNPLASTASMSTASAASVNGAVSVQIEPGLYWWATNCDNGTATFSAQGTSNLKVAGIIGSTTQANMTVSPLAGYTTPQTFGTWPNLTSASFTESVSSNAIPVVQFQVGSIP